MASVTEVLQGRATATRCHRCAFGIRMDGVCDQSCVRWTALLGVWLAIGSLALAILTIAPK